MRIIINDTEKNFPSSLSEITLGQRIDFYNQYGKDLDERALAISKMEDGPDKELSVLEFHFDKMIKTFSFFSGFDIESLRECDFLDAIANIYHSCLAQIMEDESEVELQAEYEWNGELWQLHPTELKNGSKMTFGELIDAKQTVQNMADLGSGKWEAMQYLCAIFLRKKDEVYDEKFLYDNSERLQLMRELPLNIAMAVGFFLSSSLNIFMNTSPSSSLRLSEVQTNIQNSTFNGGDGLIS